MLALLRLTVRRARTEHLAQIAGSLTFTTVLSAVPFLAVCFALFTRFPVFSRFEQALEEHLLKSLLPADIARTVLRYLNQFAANADSLTLAGSVFLFVTAIALLLTIENALNQIWSVRTNRPLLRRVGLYALVMAVGPLLLGAILWATSYLVGISAGWIAALPPPVKLVLDLGPFALTLAGLSSLFYFMPNTAVRRRDAIAGALIASFALELGKRGFAIYVLRMPTYKAVYGTFAAVPIFLLWVYFSWLVILTAALLTASAGHAAQPGRRRRGRRQAG